jgi:receptor protein-tyrosine kinase
MSVTDNNGQVTGHRLSLVERAAQRLSASKAPLSASAPVGLGLAKAPAAPTFSSVADAPEIIGDSPKSAHSPIEPVSDAESKSGNLVNLDLDAFTARHLLTPRGEQSRMAEEYRAIKRPLLQYARAAFSKPELKGNLIMVTSSIPGEGKTFTTVNLAMSIAKERDLHVLLIDADLSRPSLAARLGIEGKLGLTELLEDDTLDVSQVLLRTNIRNLSLITAGRANKMGTELLASRRAETVIHELARRYHDRIILFDTSPIQATNEGGALAAEVGQVILVVEAERTTEMEVKGSLEMLSACPNVMLLLNKAKTRFGRYSGTYFGSYYGQDSGA